MNARVKSMLIPERSLNFKSLANRKNQNEPGLAKLQKIKACVKKELQFVDKNSNSSAKIEKNFKQQSTLKIGGLANSKPTNRDTISSKIEREEMIVEKHCNNNATRLTVNSKKNENDVVPSIKKPPPKFKNLIAQSSTLKNLITRQLQQNNQNLRKNIYYTDKNFESVQNKSNSAKSDFQNVDCTNTKMGVIRIQNEDQNCNRVSFNNSRNSVNTFNIEKQSSTVTLLKSHLTKVKMTIRQKQKLSFLPARDKTPQESSFRNIASRLLDSFDKNDSFEESNLQCNELMNQDQFNERIDVETINCDGCGDLESGEITEIKSDIFDFQHKAFENLYDSETIHFLIDQEEIYKVSPDFLERCQKNVTWHMRAVLFDWMQEVCSDYLFKRETFHYATNFVDRYLSAVCNVEINQLQLIGLGSLFLASKAEEVYTPKIENIATAANNSYSVKQIQQMEIKLFKVRSKDTSSKHYASNFEFMGKLVYGAVGLFYGEIRFCSRPLFNK